LWPAEAILVGRIEIVICFRILFDIFFLKSSRARMDDEVSQQARAPNPQHWGAFVLFVRFTRGAANLGRALDRAAGRFLFGEFFLT
jgi:hypothetical protein